MPTLIPPSSHVAERAAAAAPLAALVHRRSSLVAVLAGDWTLERAPSFAQLVAATAVPTGAPAVTVAFDATALGSWDSSLLIFLLQSQDHCTATGLAFDATALPERLTRLLALARAVPDRAPAVHPPAPHALARLGRRGLAAWDAMLAAVTFIGQVSDGLARLVVRRARPRARAFWVVVQQNSSGALPIVTLIAFLIGVIIAFLGVVVLKRFGAGYYVSYLVGFGVLREMGALMTGIIMAGRTSAAFAAELGTMKVTEEIDALSTLGISPIDHLVVPRVLGIFVMMPLLVIYADAIGIAGGLFVAVALLDLSPTQFTGGLLAAVTLSDAMLGVFKATVYGLIIGMAGCMKGLQTGTDAGAVGRAATAAVVLAITLIILANAVIDWLAALLQV